jgi:hypothetical protein
VRVPQGALLATHPAGVAIRPIAVEPRHAVEPVVARYLEGAFTIRT